MQSYDDKFRDMQTLKPKAIPRFVLLLMTSRSGSSMVADIVRRHGYFWARDEEDNPLVGGRRALYNSFENQTVKTFNKREFGVPLGDMITYDDSTLRAFGALVKHEYGGQEQCVWKGAVEFFPVWWGLHEAGLIDARPMIIWRSEKGVKDSLRAKRRGRVDEQKLDEITARRFETMGTLASDFAFPVIYTEELIQGLYDSLQQAFECYGMTMQGAICNQTIDVSMWERDR